MASEFLVLYDYGTGGLWAVVVAESADQITSRYPEVEVVAERPGWMDDDQLERLRRLRLDVSASVPEGIFAAVVADRAR